jgi:phage tail sheath protein FI
MQYPTSGDYILEQNAFPNSVVEVATAIPAFIGYTERAFYRGKELKGTPTRVESLQDFVAYFGEAPVQQFNLAPLPPKDAVATLVPLAVEASTLTFLIKGEQKKYLLAPAESALYYLYNAIHLFYLNGGTTCYIVSIGDCDNADSNKDDFAEAIDALKYEQDPTMLLCPDALRLNEDEYYGVTQQMLSHCAEMQSRVAIFDVYKGAITDPRQVAGDDSPIARFRTKIGQNYLSYGIAYFPWVETSIVSLNEVSFRNLTTESLTLLLADLNPDAAAPQHEGSVVVEAPAKAVPVLSSGDVPDTTRTENIFTQAIALQTPAVDQLPDPTALQAKREEINNKLIAFFPYYTQTLTAVARYLSTLPVAPAMAGVYTATDNSRGVWKAPANVSLNAVTAPTVSLSDSTQSNLNVDASTGKSINTIRPFKGLGVLVWGGRTLDGNSDDWRYVNVRRTLVMIEQSVKLATRTYEFEPNNATTWVTVQSMINSFLFNLWKQGALLGTVPADAYSVSVGLGTSMTTDDVLRGIMRVLVQVALVRPAEFILLTFEQQMPGA